MKKSIQEVAGDGKKNKIERMHSEGVNIQDVRKQVIDLIESKELDALEEKRTELRKLLGEIENEVHQLERVRVLEKIEESIESYCEQYDVKASDIFFDFLLDEIPFKFKKSVRDIRKAIAGIKAPAKKQPPRSDKRKKKKSEKNVQKAKAIRKGKSKVTKASLLANRTFVLEAKDMKNGQTALSKKYGTSVSTIRRCRIELKVL
jgi:hypothetical protein